MLLGNDIIVTVYHESDAPSLRKITLHIDGVSIPVGVDTRSVEVGATPASVTYPGLASE